MENSKNKRVEAHKRCRSKSKIVLRTEGERSLFRLMFLEKNNYADDCSLF